MFVGIICIEFDVPALNQVICSHEWRADWSAMIALSRQILPTRQIMRSLTLKRNFQKKRWLEIVILLAQHKNFIDEEFLDGLFAFKGFNKPSSVLCVF